ncbi:MAG TPA: prephenate dehydrogenase/arogenate dehydrogenase family protein [Chitinivibrionales bacterium]|jgi:prephenate dehydrogenase|nr:prephenate dehydrogenase/arogenate dehydrogenase family protein [Chitinivibrionales bacterium]
MNRQQDAFPPKVVTVYSVGLLGGSIGLALKASGYKGRIVGLSSEQAIRAAKALGCIDEGYGYDALDTVIQSTDCLFLCSPIHGIIAALERLGKLPLPAGCIVTDVGSTKSEIVAAARRFLPPGVHFIGGHPMAGSEKRGPSSADPYLFQDAIYVLTPGDSVPAPVADGFACFLEANLGCRHVRLSPEAHDTIAATVSHLPHILAVALVNAAAAMDGRSPGTLALAAGGFRDMTRIVSSPYALWRDILSTNKDRIAPLIDEFAAALLAMKELLLRDGLDKAFNAAAETRAKIPRSSKGFIGALSEVFVVVKDQPGMIALMANACAKENINIKDIEVLKVRENEAGTIRLAFESRDTARRVVELFKNLGITAWERE